MRYEIEQQVAREMAERGWKVGEIKRSIQMPDWWVRRVLRAVRRPPRVASIDKPGVREALAEICAGVRHQEVHDKHGRAAFDMAFRLWARGERQ